MALSHRCPLMHRCSQYLSMSDLQKPVDGHEYNDRKYPFFLYLRSTSLVPFSKMASWKGVSGFVVLLTLLSPSRAQDSGTCFTNAFGVVAEQVGWVICPGSANQAGIQTCCASASDCGEDSLCHVAPSKDPGANNWYLSGCTDQSFQDSSCRTDCGK